MLRHALQPKLFDLGQTLPNGLVYRPDFLTRDEEEILLAYFDTLPLTHPTYTPKPHDGVIADTVGEVTAKRRHMGFGWGWDYRRERLVPGEDLPRFLQPVQRKIGKWLGIAPGRVAEALINEYTPGSAIGWHRDNEGFEKIVGVSLAGWCKMKFRPLNAIGDKDAVVTVELEPRSAYIMQGPVRWQWQHSVAAVPALRYSITFRTLPPGTI